MPVMPSGLINASLRSKILWVVFGGVLVTVLCSAVLIAQTRQSMAEQALRSQHVVAQTYATMVEQYLAASKQGLELLATRPAIRAPIDRSAIVPALHGVPEDGALPQREAARSLLEAMPRFGSVSLLTDSYDVVLMEPFFVQTSLPVGNLGQRDFYRVARTTGQTAWGGVIVAAASDGPVPLVVLATGVKDADGTVTSVLGAGLDLQVLATVASRVQLGDSANLMLFDARGVPVVYPDPSRILAGQPLVEYPPIQRALAGTLGTLEYHNPLTGEDELGAVVRLGDVGWYAVVSQTKSAAFASLDRLGFILSGIVGLAVMLLLAGGLVLARSISRAVGQVERAARGIAAGDLDQHVTIATNDELGRMATAFGEMIRYQQDVAAIADAVAAGDLTIDVRPLSDRDRFGIALHGMVSALQVQVAERERAEAALRESERHARQVIETAHEGVWIGDRELRTTFINARLAEMLGATPDELIGRQLHSFVADQSLLDPTTNAVAPLDEPVRYDVELRRRDGTQCWVLVSMSPLPGPDGARVGTLAMVTDITDRKQSEEALRVLDRAMAATSTAVAISDVRLPTHPVVYVNPAFERLTGYTADEIVGRRLDVLSGPDTDVGTYKELTAAFTAERNALLTSISYRKDGTTFWSELALAPVRAADGQASHYVWLLTDISARKQAESQAEALARSEKLRALGQLASGVAHDLNQSLMLIASYGDLARRALDQATLDRGELREMFTVVTQAALDGGDTVKRLLQFARAPIDAPTTAIDLTALAREVAQLTAPRWRDAAQPEGRPIKLELETSGHPVVLGSAAPLRDALMNLVSNAIDALPNGGSIQVRVLDAAEQAVLEVQSRIFEPFFTTKGEKGTGLGLPTLFGLVERLNGQVQVQSSPGVGTTFTLRFPLAEAPAPMPTSATTTRQPAEQQRLRILAVDDEPALTKAVVRLLRPRGHIVKTASSGEEALECLAAEPYDLVLSDVGWAMA